MLLYNLSVVYVMVTKNDHESASIAAGLKVTVDLQRPNFAIFFFVPDIAKI